MTQPQARAGTVGLAASLAAGLILLALIAGIGSGAVDAAPVGPAAAEGDLDATFGAGGLVTTTVGLQADARAVVVQGDGKIVVAGSRLSPDYETGAALARYLPGGTLDPDFGTGGLATEPAPPGTVAVCRDVALQTDGKIVCAGFAATAGRSHFLLARYRADGSLDPAFGSGGVVTTAINSQDSASAVLIQPDAKIVVAGSSRDALNNSLGFALARYLPGGGLDPAFGTGGVVVTPVSGNWDAAFALARQADGKIVAGGRAGSDGVTEFALACYLPGGGLDPAFGSGGIATTSLGGYNAISALGQQSGGQFVAVGVHDAGGREQAALARFTAVGALDTTFGSGGTTLTLVGEVGSPAEDALVLSGDGIAVAGSSRTAAGSDLMLLRYTPGGQLDPAFGAGGVVTTSLAIGPAYGRGVAQQRDKLIAAGDVQLTAGLDADSVFVVARYFGGQVTQVYLPLVLR
ncbi:MAG: delta-60 repeat domain-containing protein [Anaerolineae bacterium]|jgi:uncharacterized delta-60 repeat protein